MSTTSAAENAHAKILQEMALGNDPFSGQPLPPDHILHRPEVIRALMVATAAITQPRKAKQSASGPQRAGTSWTDTDDSKLREMFERGESISALSLSFQRTGGAIKARLVKLGLVDDLQAILER
jgi:hypothetical protein